MALVTSKELLLDAQRRGYAVGAFNVENMEMAIAVLAAAEETGSPVIMQTTPSTVKFAGLDYYLAIVRAAAERASVPVVMHLDHGNSFQLAMQALRTGYTSIMIDGSKLSFQVRHRRLYSQQGPCGRRTWKGGRQGGRPCKRR